MGQDPGKPRTSFGQTSDTIRANLGHRLGKPWTSIWANLGHHSGKARTKFGQTSDIIRANLGHNPGQNTFPYLKLEVVRNVVSINVQGLPELCSRFARIMSEVCPEFVRGLPKLCPRFARIMSEVCPNFCRGLPGSCPKLCPNDKTKESKL